MTWLPEALLYICAALMLRLWVISFARIKGKSMLPTLQDRELALVWRLPCRFRPPRRQEVVICHYPGRRIKHCRYLPQSFVKRIIGLPGDTIEVIEGTVHINGRPLHEPYLDPERCRFMRSRPPQVLDRDEYFVMGDHRDRSNDSRSVGPIRRRDIRGRVVCVLWPLRNARKLH